MSELTNLLLGASIAPYVQAIHEAVEAAVAEDDKDFGSSGVVHGNDLRRVNDILNGAKKSMGIAQFPDSHGELWEP